MEDASSAASDDDADVDNTRSEAAEAEQAAAPPSKAPRRVTVTLRTMIVTVVICLLAGAAGVLGWLYMGAQEKLDAQAREASNRQRAEEIFEMVRDRLADSPFAAEPKARIVLSGGAAQLTGIPELASQILGRPVRIARPLGFGRLPHEAKTASFSVPTGLLVYPQYAHLEHVEPRHTRQLRTGTDGYFGKVGRWLREGF